MLFTTSNFLFIFLPITFGIFCVIQKFHHLKLSSAWLLFASIIFYISWSPWDLIPLFCSILVNFLLYKWMNLTRDQSRFWILWLGITLNLCLLVYYKYFNFILTNILWFPQQQSTETIPLGISFYTFTQIAFLIDCYKNNYKKNDFLNYSLFVSYFPHLICGPIISFKDLYPQLTNPNKFHVSSKNISLFIFCFSIGFFKKLFIADQFGEFASQVFDAPNAPYFSQKTAFYGVISYTLQLYFDFSGYSDMAVGLSYLFGLKIPDNFNAPYQSTSIIEFWRRWHISLSSFLKNYLYIPLGGNKTHHYSNLFITMILGGFWHGASWTFVVWGIYQGILLSLNHLYRTHFKERKLMNEPNKTRIINFFKIIFTFTLVSLGWVLFRAADLKTASHIYSSLFNIVNDTAIITISRNFSTKLLIFSFIWVFFVPDTLTMREKFLTWIENQSARYIIATAFICALFSAFGLICLNKTQQFLYSGF